MIVDRLVMAILVETLGLHEVSQMKRLIKVFLIFF